METAGTNKILDSALPCTGRSEGPESEKAAEFARNRSEADIVVEARIEAVVWLLDFWKGSDISHLRSIPVCEERAPAHE